MLNDSPLEVIGNSSIEHSMILVGHDVNVVLVLFHELLVLMNMLAIILLHELY